MTEFNRSLAVVIGINQYQNGIHPLKTAVPDAKELAGIFQHPYEYTLVHSVLDTEEPILDQYATLEHLRTLLTETLPNKIKPTKEDRLLFYFAGHGIARNSDQGPEGFLVPQDADLQKPNSFLPMRELHDSLAELECRHLLVILDCCFAGAFRWSSTRKGTVVPQTIHWEHYHRFIKCPAWQVIASASHDQEAFEWLNRDNRETGKSEQHSPFAEGLFEALREQKADLIKDGVITAPELYLYLRDYVELNSKELQTPGLWYLKKHDRGEYVFHIPGSSPKLTPAPKLKEENNPYRGLKAFDEEHARFFFGRQELTEQLYTKLVQNNQQLTVVLGISGSGKSSLVKAGLIPQLRIDKDVITLSKLTLIQACILTVAICQNFPCFPLKFLPICSVHNWHILETIRPGANPYSALAKAFFPLKSNRKFSAEELKVWGEQLKGNPQQLISLISTWSQQYSPTKLLLVIDQFEELITLARKDTPASQEKKLTGLDKLKSSLRLPFKSKSKTSYQERKEASQDEWQSFIELLAYILKKCPQLSLVLTLRSDFEPRFKDSAFQSNWAKSRFVVRPMRSDELREAVERPATEMALYFDPSNLVDKIVDEVVQMPGALPLLSFTLSELYIKLHKAWIEEGKEDRALTVDEEFNQQGGIAGVLTRRANEEYNNLPDNAHRVTMRRVMLRMVEIEGGEAVRRRVPLSELTYPSVEENQRVEKVLKRLDQARLIIRGQESGEAYVEPAHDFLVRGWDKLQDWIQEEQENLALQRLLTPVAEAWDNTGRKIGDLWDDNSRLDRLREIRQSQLSHDKNWFNHLETKFVDYSLRRRRNKILQLTGAVSTFITIIIVFASIQYIQRVNAELQYLATSSETLSASNQHLEALIEALKVGRKQANAIWTTKNTQIQVVLTLQQALYSIREQNRFVGHTEQVNSVSFSPNSKVIGSASIASARNDGSIKLWNLQGRKIGDIKGQKLGFEDISFSPDSKTLVAANGDGSLTLLSLDGKPINHFGNDEPTAISVSFSPDGQTIASGHTDGTVKLWNLDGVVLNNFRHGHEDFEWVFDVAFSPDGQTLVSAGQYSAILWNTDGKELKSFKHDGAVKSVSFSPDGKMIASAEEGRNRAILWRSDNGQKKCQLDHPFVESVSFSFDGQIVASAGWGKTIKIWEASSCEKLATLKGHSSEILGLSFSPNENILVSASADKTVKLWNLTHVKPKALEEQRYSIRDISFSPDGKTFATANADQTVKLWNLDGSLHKTFDGHTSTVESVAFSSDGSKIASGSGGTVTIWNRNGKKLRTFKMPEVLLHRRMLRAARVSDVSFSRDQTMLVAASRDGVISLWHLESGKEIKTFQDVGSVVSFSPDSEVLVYAGQDNTLRVWSIDDGKEKSSTERHNSTITSISFSPDGRKIASGSKNGTIILWSRNGRRLETLKGHNSIIGSLSFSPDSKLMASGSGDYDVKLWSLDSMDQNLTSRLLNLQPGISQQQKTFKEDKGNSIAYVSFSPDGKTLAVVGLGGTLWNLDLDDLLRRGCDWVRDYLHNNPNLSNQERHLCE